MRKQLVFTTLVTLVSLLITLTLIFFASNSNTISDSEADIAILVAVLVIGLIVFAGILCFSILSTRKERAFLKEHGDQLSSEDPKVLLEFSGKCDEYLKDKYSFEVSHLSQQAKTKATNIQKQIDFQANLATFKSEISEDGSHPRVISTLKEHMHNPDSFQHVSSEYEDVKKDGKHYYKITMACRGTNTFGALVLQTHFFLLDEDNQISVIGSPDGTESGAVNMEKLSVSMDVAASAFEGIASAADLLAFFSSGDEE